MTDTLSAYSTCRLMVITLKKPELEWGFLEKIEERLKIDFPLAVKIAANVYLFRRLEEAKQIETACIPILPEGAQFLSFSLLPPVVGLCDRAIVPLLSGVGLDPYCTPA